MDTRTAPSERQLGSSSAVPQKFLARDSTRPRPQLFADNHFEAMLAGNLPWSGRLPLTTIDTKPVWPSARIRQNRQSHPSSSSHGRPGQLGGNFTQKCEDHADVENSRGRLNVGYF